MCDRKGKDLPFARLSKHISSVTFHGQAAFVAALSVLHMHLRLPVSLLPSPNAYVAFSQVASVHYLSVVK